MCLKGAELHGIIRKMIDRSKLEYIQCPRCSSSALTLEDGQVKCDCGQIAAIDNNSLNWGEQKPNLSKGRFKELVYAALNPLVNPYSPLVRLTKYKEEGYYNRVLGDIEMAKRWRDYYLKDYQRDRNPVILDHGCGKGRNMAMARNLGFTVLGQDVSPNEWWRNIPEANIQVTSPSMRNLPWKSNTIDIVCDMMVIGFYDDSDFSRLAAEVYRVLRSGGMWLIYEANAQGAGMHVTRGFYGRLHHACDISKLTENAGFKRVALDYEGYNTDIFPRTFNYIRNVMLKQKFDYYDYGWAPKYISETKRKFWVMRLIKE